MRSFIGDVALGIIVPACASESSRELAAISQENNSQKQGPRAKNSAIIAGAGDGPTWKAEI